MSAGVPVARRTTTAADRRAEACPLLILFAVCLAVAVVYRLVAGSNRDERDARSFPYAITVLRRPRQRHRL